MAFSDLEIVAGDYVGKDIESLPDVVSGQASTLKARFDSLVKDLVVARFNALLTRLDSITNHVESYTGSKANVATGAWTDVKTFTLPAGTWLILSHAEGSGGNSGTMANKLIVGSDQRATRSVQQGGGGVMNYMVATLTGNTTIKQQVYNYNSTNYTYTVAVDCIRLY